MDINEIAERLFDQFYSRAITPVLLLAVTYEQIKCYCHPIKTE